jgi:hypothetical protein
MVSVYQAPNEQRITFACSQSMADGIRTMSEAWDVPASEVCRKAISILGSLYNHEWVCAGSDNHIGELLTQMLGRNGDDNVSAG